MSQPPYPGPPYGEQPSSGQPYQGQPPYQGQQPYPGQPYPGQPSSGQPSSGQPYSGQPYPGQPNPDVPSSVPPGYPPTQPFGQPDYGQQPQYGQPQYGQPQYGQPEYGQQPQYGQPQYGQPEYGQQPGYAAPGFPPPAPPKKNRTLPIVLLSIAVVLVLCIGGTVALVLVGKNSDKNKDKVTTSGTTAPAVPTKSTDEPSAPATRNAASVKIVEPKTLDGLPKLNYKQFDSTVKLLKSIMSTYPGASGTVGAVYGRLGTKDAVLMTATKANVTDPELAVDGVVASGGQSVKVTGVTRVSTGSLGGTAKCGNATDSGEKIAVCSWADEGSIGVVFFYFKSTSQIKDDFPKVRAQLEKKS